MGPGDRYDVGFRTGLHHPPKAVSEHESVVITAEVHDGNVEGGKLPSDIDRQC